MNNKKNIFYIPKKFQKVIEIGYCINKIIDITLHFEENNKLKIFAINDEERNLYEDNTWEIKDNYIFISLGSVTNKINSYIIINDKIKIIDENEIQISTYILGYIPLKFKVQSLE